MDGPNLNSLISQLYDVVEVNLSSIPVPVAAETLRLVNPGLHHEHAYQIAVESDSRGADHLTQNDFNEAVKVVLQNTEPEDAARAVKDVVLRLRVGVRRRFLMYDAPPNTLPPQVADNSRALEMFAELFETASGGAEEITRDQLRSLTFVVLYDNKAEASTIVKSAIGTPSTDMIGFNEFVTVLQQGTRQRNLSDMVALVRHRAKGEDEGMAGTRPKAQANSPRRTAPTNQQRAFNANLSKEVASYRLQDQLAERRYQDAIGHHEIRSMLPSLPPLPQETKAERSLQTEALEREVSQLRLENEELRRELLHVQLNQDHKRSYSQQHHHDDSLYEEKEQLKRHVELLEKELRVARAHLNTARESASVLAALKQGTNPHSTVRDFFPDEQMLHTKHNYVRETASVIDDGNSPVSIVLGQYDLLVVGYQALYRELRKKYEASRQKKFDAAKAAASIVSGTPSPIPSRRSSPRRDSPMRAVAASPVKWSDLDRDPTPDMKHSGMLADPLLTPEQRNHLRGTLAAQMRKSARNYRPPSQRSRTPQREATVMTSLDAMQRLQSLSERANRERRLEH